MNADERGRARYLFDRRRVWTERDAEWFLREAMSAFPGSYEVDKDGEYVPPEQMPLDEAA